MTKTIVLTPGIALLALSSLRGGDDRFGVATHFDQSASRPNYGYTFLPRQIAATSAAWVRDEINWRLYEKTAGVYGIDATKQLWIDSCATAGLKIVALVGENPPSFYPNWTTQPAALANFCAWFAKAQAGKIQAIEVINEAQNMTPFRGTAGQQALVTLTNAVADAVHKASPGTLVLGLDEQGQQILNMLALGTPHIDGIVYHPYDPADSIPEHVYEPPFTDYQTWVEKLKSVTSIPLWETERAISGNNPRDEEYWSSIWEARRTIISYWEGIKHTFMYEASAQSGGQSFLSYYQEPRQAVFTHARLSAELPATLVPSTLAPTATSTDPKFQAANFKGLTFLAGNASAPTETVGAVWYRGAMPVGPVSLALGNVQLATVTLFHPNAKSVVALNLINGERSDMAFTQSGNNVVVPNVPISTEPVLLEVTNAGAGPGPSPTRTPM
jgi:hypothetical protein